MIQYVQNVNYPDLAMNSIQGGKMKRICENCKYWIKSKLASIMPPSDISIGDCINKDNLKNNAMVLTKPNSTCKYFKSKGAQIETN